MNITINERGTIIFNDSNSNSEKNLSNSFPSTKSIPMLLHNPTQYHRLHWACIQMKNPNQTTAHYHIDYDCIISRVGIICHRLSIPARTREQIEHCHFRSSHVGLLQQGDSKNKKNSKDLSSNFPYFPCNVYDENRKLSTVSVVI